MKYIRRSNLKVKYIDRRSDLDMMCREFTLDDNPFLDPEYIANLKKEYTGVFYDRFIRGLWVVAEGRVYPMFTDNPDRFILRGTTAGMDGQFYISIDYGTANPTAMQLWCVRGKEAVMLRESYFDSRKEGHQKTDEEYYTDLEDLARGYYIRKVIVDPSAASFIECIRRHGNFRVWEADNDVLDGIRVTASLLNAGIVKIHEGCKDAIREFGLYRWDEKKNNDGRARYSAEKAGTVNTPILLLPRATAPARAYAVGTAGTVFTRSSRDCLLRPTRAAC